MPAGTFAISEALLTGAKNNVAPTFWADAIFSLMPPIPPTIPRELIVPVPAM